MAESERRFEDIARKLATMEGELERSMDRCAAGKTDVFLDTVIYKIYKHIIGIHSNLKI